MEKWNLIKQFVSWHGRTQECRYPPLTEFLLFMVLPWKNEGIFRRNHISESSSENMTFWHFPRKKFDVFLDKKQEKKCCSLWACPQKKFTTFSKSVIFPNFFLKKTSQVFAFSPKKVTIFSKSVIFLTSSLKKGNQFFLLPQKKLTTFWKSFTFFPDFFPKKRSPLFQTSSGKCYIFPRDISIFLLGTRPHQDPVSWEPRVRRKIYFWIILFKRKFSNHK